MMRMVVSEEPLLPHPALSQQYSRSGERFLGRSNSFLLITRFIQTRRVGLGVTEWLRMAIESATVVPVGVQRVLEHDSSGETGGDDQRSATVVVVHVSHVFTDFDTFVTHFGRRTHLRVFLTT